MKKSLAFDIGGTKIFYALIDENANFLSEISQVKTSQNLSELIETLKNIIAKYEKDVDIIAIATAGAVNNTNDGLLGSTGNLPKGYNKIDFMSLSSKPVFLENDANCAAVAEWKFGAAKGLNHIIVLTLGTGVGSGIIIDGKLLKGKSGAAGEMHFKMRQDHHRLCSCGNYDCFEIYASGTALALDGKEVYKNQDITSYDVINGLKNNDTQAIEAFNNWQTSLLNGVIGLANIFDPEMIVLSGGMAQFLDYKKLEQEANKQLVVMPFSLRKANFDNNSGLIGVTYLALHQN